MEIMSIYSKISAAVACCSLLAVTAVSAFAKDLPTTANAATQPAALRKAVIQERVTTAKENAQNRIVNLREKQASAVAALKTKLEAFKNKQKAQVADRVNTTLANINQKQTAQMQKNLGVMSNILDKLEARVNKQSLPSNGKGTPDIKDPVAAKTAIASARAAIASASAAVTAQSQKDYTLQLTTELKVKQDAQTQTQKLKADITEVRKMVIEAKQSVANAIKVAKAERTFAENELKKESTTSGQQ